MLYPILASLLCVILATANLMAVKMIDVFSLTLPAAVLCYPFAFVVGDLLTEFYGFRTTRKVVFLAFALNAVSAGFLALAAVLPASRYFQHDAAFRVVFLTAPRILGASFAAFLISGVFNSFVFDYLRRRKIPLLARSSASTFFGVILDSAVFISLAFCGVMPARDLLFAILCQILAKLAIGIGIGAPLTWCVVKKLRAVFPATRA